MLKKIFNFILLLLVTFSVNVFADEITSESTNDLTATKVAIKDEKKVGEYDIKISVPGKETEESNGYNVLFVIDASYSMDSIGANQELSKWQKMRNSIISLANTILPNADSSRNFNKLGLITFGIDSHVNIPFTSSIDEFMNKLPVYSSNALLPGRSATNNEVGLLGAREYLESLSLKDKEHTFVIYITDGESNMSEIQFNWYERLLSGIKYRNNEVLTLNTDYLMSTLITIDANKDNITYASLFDTIMDDIKLLYKNTISELDTEDLIDLYRNIIETEEVITNEEMIDEILNKIDLDNILRYLNSNNYDNLINILKNGIYKMYEYMGYDFYTTYSAGKFERMFTNVNWVSDINLYENTKYYDSSSATSLVEHIQDIFYISMLTASYSKVDNAQRAVNEGLNLSEYATIYTIAYNTSNALFRNDAKKIMDPNYEGNGNEYTSNINNHYSSGYYFSNIEEISTSLKKLSEQIIKTIYSNVFVIDYTSKWVTPKDINNDNIFDEKDIIITNNGIVVDNALVEVNELTKEYLLTLTDEEVKQIKKDLDLINNTSNKIYRIKWIITEDTLYKYDQYQLMYRVKVDTKEKEFISEKEYNANGITTLIYSKNNIIDNEIEIEEVHYDIKVPTVSQKENIIIIEKKDAEGNVLEGADFDIISKDNSNNIKKEYSNDKINWTSENNNATYFKFSSIYDDKYEIEETKVPNNYIKSENISYDFTNKEGTFIEEKVVNTKKTGEVIIHYVIKAKDEYIPLNEYAYDEKGNIQEDFKDIDLEDITLTGDIDTTYETIYKEINNYDFIGLYEKDLTNKLNGNTIKGTYTEDTKEYTYVYELNIKIDTDTDTGIYVPNTGLSVTIYNNYVYAILGVLTVIKKFIIK